MRFSPTKLLHGLLYTAPVLLLTLAACGGGGSSGTVAPVNPPAAPTGVTLVAGCNAINISWSAVAGATGYNVYGAASGVTATKLTATSPITTTSYTDAGLLGNTTYNYQVTAVNSAGEGPTSTVATAATKNSCAVMGGSIQGNPLTLTPAVSTLAGTAGTAGAADGTGAAAKFTSPQGITTDGTYLYVADTTNNTIRKIAISTGEVTTLAGSLIGASGSADAPSGPGTSATFSGPRGITTDGANLYVADTQNSSIRKIVIISGAVSTIVSTGLSSPAAITFDGAVSLYIADTNNNLIKKVATTGGTPATFSTSSVSSPQGITYDGTGLNFYVTSGNDVLKVAPTGVVTTIPTIGLSSPQGITTDGTNLYVADYGNHVIRMVTTAGAVTTVAGSGTEGSADGTSTSATFSFPSGITTDGTNLYDADTGKNTIRKIQ